MRYLPFIILLLALACSAPDHTLPPPPVATGSGQPALAVAGNDLLLSWQEKAEDGYELKIARLSDNWQKPLVVAKGSDWFVNWADFPSVLVNGDKMFTYFLAKDGPKSYYYNIMYTFSADGGASWREPARLHQDTVQAEHGFVSGVPYEQGFMVSWLDGRYAPAGGFMTIRSAIVDATGRVQQSFEVDSTTCDCCQTHMVLVNGQPWVFYRNRTSDEIRDIYFARFVEGAWSEPQLLHADNWQIRGCPVNGPRAATYGNRVAVAWFTGAGGKGRVKLKIITGEQVPQEAVVVDSVGVLGRVDVQMDEQRIYLTYLKSKADNGVLILAVYDHDGNLVRTRELAPMSTDRGSGFGRTALWHGRLVYAFTDPELPQVRLGSIAVE